MGEVEPNRSGEVGTVDGDLDENVEGLDCGSVDGDCIGGNEPSVGGSFNERREKKGESSPRQLWP